MRLFFTHALVLLCIAGAWAHADPLPLPGVPAEVQADLQRVREARSKRLSKREADLSESALKAFTQAGMPTDPDGIRRAMEATDATAYLPDVEAMLSVDEPKFIHREKVSAIVEKAKKQGRLSYFDLRESLAQLTGVSAMDEEFVRFPLLLSFPEANSITVDSMANRFALGMGPIEITQMAKEADGRKLSPKDYAVHDENHFFDMFSLEYWNLVYEQNKVVRPSRFSREVQHVALRLDFEKKIDELGLGFRKFEFFHENGNLFPASMAIKLGRLKSQKARELAVESVVIQYCEGSFNVGNHEKEKIYLDARKRAAVLLSDPDPGVRAVSAELLALTIEANRDGHRVPEIDLALQRAFLSEEIAIQQDVLSALVSFQRELDDTTYLIVSKTLSQNNSELKREVLKSLYWGWLKKLSKEQLIELIPLLLKSIQDVDPSDAAGVMRAVLQVPQLEEILGALDPSVASLLEAESARNLRAGSVNPDAKSCLKIMLNQHL